MLLIFGSYEASKKVIDHMNSSYEPKNSLVTRNPAASNEMEDNKETADIDRMISHVVNGTKETSLPVKYEKNFTVYENKLYVTNNKGKTWIMVPEDSSPGYARISEYMDTISESNIFVSNNKVSIVYGGRGSENISIISTDCKGDVWSVGTISKTATHDLKNGYDKLYISFLENGKTGYIAAVRNKGIDTEKITAFRSVNSGVTFESVEPSGNVNANDLLYKKIKAQFGF
jgi:hypothetical protein